MELYLYIEKSLIFERYYCRSSYLSRDERFFLFFFSFLFLSNEGNPILILFLIFLPSARDRFFHFCPVNYSNRQSVAVPPAYDNRLWKKLGPSGSELSSCSLLSIEEETSFEQELPSVPFYFFIFFFFPPLYAIAWDVSERWNYSSVLYATNGDYPRGSRENRSVNLSRIVESLLGNHAYPFDSHHFSFLFFSFL